MLIGFINWLTKIKLILSELGGMSHQAQGGHQFFIY